MASYRLNKRPFTIVFFSFFLRIFGTFSDQKLIFLVISVIMGKFDFASVLWALALFLNALFLIVSLR